VGVAGDDPTHLCRLNAYPPTTCAAIEAKNAARGSERPARQPARGRSGSIEEWTASSSSRIALPPDNATMTDRCTVWFALVSL
jgi:hypothetical protein